MRILIVGAGIGGMTLAALLERRGVTTTLVDRAPSFEHAGYMLGLYSLGYRVLHGLGLYKSFAAASVPMDAYAVHDGHGEPIKTWSMAPITERFGPVLSSTRPQLVEILRGGLGRTEVRFATAIAAIAQHGNEVRAELSDGSSATFDLVVGADGMHSRVRELVFGAQPAHDTGWGGWVHFADTRAVGSLSPGTVVEYWGAGRFLGAYPTTRGHGVIACAPVDGAFESAGAGRRERVLAKFAGMGEVSAALLESLPADDVELFFWRLADVRSAEWVRGRVVLLGDAAAGFLPTAGIGASMAMESAAVLADELERVDVSTLDHALALYVKRRRHRVERIQDDSRKLARMMFVESTPIAAIRNLATRFYSLDSLAKQIAEAFDEPI